ncbi:MAG: hypothetical protein LBD84_00690 [Campylobacteraceae bacterium]|nr:hypothetical protein [Campylobacteraceae bacterium]
MKLPLNLASTSILQKDVRVFIDDTLMLKMQANITIGFKRQKRKVLFSDNLKFSKIVLKNFAKQNRFSEVLLYLGIIKKIHSN